MALQAHSPEEMQGTWDVSSKADRTSQCLDAAVQGRRREEEKLEGAHVSS